MKHLATLLPLLATAEAVNVVSMNIARNPAVQGKIINSRGLGKRSTITESLINNVTAGSYLATVKIGTPPQTMTLALDTGSSDLWVLSNDALICEEQFESSDCVFGTFDSNSSSTFDDIIPGGFSITYQDDTGAEGDYFTDDLTFANATVKNLQMGLGAGQTSVSLGIMGIGYDTNEATAGQPGESKYPNIIDELVSQKLINIEAYSLWLDDLNASTGSILFGGIDTNKYSGSLISTPIQADPTSGETTISSFTVSLTGLTTKNGSNTTSDSGAIAIPVVLDSGTTLTYLPKSLTKTIYNAVGAIDDTDNSEMVLVDCNLQNTSADATFNYQFGSTSGPIISVALPELMFSIPDIEWQELEEDPPFENTCMFGIFPQAEGGPYLLGDTFLRSAYVVYDLKNNQIGLAQTDFNSEGSNIVEIAASASAIPLVSGVASGVTVTPTTGLPGVGLQSSGTATASNSAASGSVPVFEMSGLLVFIVSAFFSLMGGVWLVS